MKISNAVFMPWSASHVLPESRRLDFRIFPLAASPQTIAFAGVSFLY
jgi:hypothetical protein